MIRPFRTIQPSTLELNLIQGNVGDALKSIMQCPLLDGVLLRQVALVSGSNLVSHGLGRNYVSWAPMNPSAPAMLSYAASPDPSQYVNIVASAPCKSDLYVF